ncbi:MAG: ABC transporter ATPase [Flavobacteriaceae bacterium]|nr:ABC transporter ATPase [Flavobacteriaceae bacterium]
MLVGFDQLPDSSKIWIYQSNRKFYPQEIDEIKQSIETFLNGWKNKGEGLKASYQIKYNRFIIIAADTTDISLTVESIDASVMFMMQLQETYSVELLDKLNVSFKQGEFVQYKELKAFQKLIKSKSISAKTIVFNNLINTKEELESDWEIPITESWHNRFL